MGMRIAGLPEEINEQLNLIPVAKQYFEELAAHPYYVKTGQADTILDPITDDNLRHALIHIGKHNELPELSELKNLTSGEHVDAYTNVMEFGWANLRSRSMLPSWITHFVGSALFDALILLT